MILRFPLKVIGVCTTKSLAIKRALVKLRGMGTKWSSLLDDEDALAGLDDYEICTDPEVCTDYGTIFLFDYKEGPCVHFYIYPTGLDVLPPNSKPERVSEEAEGKKESETKQEAAEKSTRDDKAEAEQEEAAG